MLRQEKAKAASTAQHSTAHKHTPSGVTHGAGRQPASPGPLPFPPRRGPQGTQPCAGRRRASLTH